MPVAAERARTVEGLLSILEPRLPPRESGRKLKCTRGDCDRCLDRMRSAMYRGGEQLGWWTSSRTRPILGVEHAERFEVDRLVYRAQLDPSDAAARVESYGLRTTQSASDVERQLDDIGRSLAVLARATSGD